MERGQSVDRRTVTGSAISRLKIGSRLGKITWNFLSKCLSPLNVHARRFLKGGPFFQDRSRAAYKRDIRTMLPYKRGYIGNINILHFILSFKQPWRTRYEDLRISAQADTRRAAGIPWTTVAT